MLVKWFQDLIKRTDCKICFLFLALDNFVKSEGKALELLETVVSTLFPLTIDFQKWCLILFILRRSDSDESLYFKQFKISETFWLDTLLHDYFMGQWFIFICYGSGNQFSFLLVFVLPHCNNMIDQLIDLKNNENKLKYSIKSQVRFWPYLFRKLEEAISIRNC